MRLVLLTNDQPNQTALAAKLSQVYELAAVVTSRNIPKRKKPQLSRVRSSINALAVRSAGRQFLNAWNELQARYRGRFGEFQPAERIQVNNVNEDATLEAIERLKPDVTLVSGTNLLGPKLISTISDHCRILNLHTGISPYVKGGPNCTNWCLSEGWFHMIGNTIMWIDAGIDSGNIVATERTKLDGSESLAELHWKVMEHAHDMYVRTVVRMAKGLELPSIPQSDLPEGRTFLSSEWTVGAMFRASRKFSSGYRAYFRDHSPTEAVSNDLRLFPLSDD
jgi:methionyl-tRNA formyltransferase